MLFGKKKNETAEERGIGSAIELGERIEIFDSYGRKASMLKTDWAEKLLPARLKECWDNADRLYAEIIFNVDNNMAYEVTEAAEHLAANALYQIEVDGLTEVVFDAEKVKKLFL